MSLVKTFEKARIASRKISTAPTDLKNSALKRWAELLEEQKTFLINENKKDLIEQEGKISKALHQRLKLDEAKIEDLVAGVHGIIRQSDPAGAVTWKMKMDDGLTCERVSVPIGVIGVVFESRPDALAQIAALALKSGNAVLLKGGKEAHHSNKALLSVLDRLTQEIEGLPEGWAQLLDSREAFQEMLKYSEYVDLVIPRGSNQLVRTVMESTSIPVLGHADGICHTYVHESADVDSAARIALDGKIQYPSGCNATETLLVDENIASKFLGKFVEMALGAGVELRGCERTQEFSNEIKPASEEDWKTEYGDLILSVRVVDGIDSAIDHINTYGSHHTDTICATQSEAIERFLNTVDSACVHSNASTRFADGFRYGLGAEVGISTNRTHARGPVGLEGLVIYKYRVRGSNQTVSDYSGKDGKKFKHEVMD